VSGANRTGGARIVDVFLSIRSRIERVIAARVGDQAAAADLTQDLYLRLHRVGASLANDDDAQHYLMRMAINATIDHQRVESRRTELLSGVVELFDDPQRSPEDEALTDDQIRSVDRALRALPEKCREMLFLSRVQGLTHDEIAKQMGVSRALVEKYVIRALLHCRAQLTQEDDR
jgi:RNA polymerase sigma factor (sigma-70 family)